MRVFKTKWFSRFARKEKIDDRSLADAVRRAERGMTDADLGGGVVKLRVARSGEGRSGGYRMCLAYRRARVAVFLYAFAKSQRDNIDEVELAALQEIAAGWLGASAGDWNRQLREGFAEEVDFET